MKPYYLLHNIIKFKGFSSTIFELLNLQIGIFRKNLTVAPEIDYTGSYAG